MLDLLRQLVAELEAGRSVVSCTVVRHHGSTPQEAGARMLLLEDGRTVGTVGGGAIEFDVLTAAREVQGTGRATIIERRLGAELGMCCGGRMEVFVERQDPAPVALIFGGGHVGAAVARVAGPLGFTPWIVDERDAFVLGHGAGTRVVHAHPRDALPELPWGERTFVLVTTHDHHLDEELARLCLQRPLRWVGVIASRAKALRFRERLLARGVEPASVERLRGPVGLDIGARTPEEIALSIVAEWVAVRRGALERSGHGHRIEADSPVGKAG